MSFAGYFLPVLFCMLSMLISDSRFDLVWFRLSCDHGWIRSGSVNVRKQQQQQLYTTIDYGELGLQLSLKENQKRTVSYKEKIRTHGILNGFPVGSNLELTVIVGESPITMIYIYINHHAQPPIIPQHNHSNTELQV